MQLQLRALVQRFSEWQCTQNAVFQGAAADHRLIKPGNLFVAIKGERVDGHDFVEQAKQQGAVAALVDHAVGVDLPQLIVLDVVNALGEIAAVWRSMLNIPIIALTGSCGKTTTREMIKSILSEVYSSSKVFASPKNYNSDIGVPLSLLMLTPEYDIAVLEMGMNYLGEIARNARYASPIDIAAITSIAPVHISKVGGTPGVIKAKSEIFQGLSPQGMAILPYEFLSALEGAIESCAYLTFGLDKRADICVANVDASFDRCQFKLIYQQQSVEITLNYPGKHNAENAACAAAMAVAHGMSLEKIKKGLENTKSVARRLQRLTAKGGAVLLDDGYNANPKAVKSAIDILSKFSGKRIFVFGDMAELGDEAGKFHEKIGCYAKQQGIDVLYAIGKFTPLTVRAFGANGKHFTSREALIAALLEKVAVNTCFLVKGSFSMNMKAFVDALIN